MEKIQLVDSITTRVNVNVVTQKMIKTEMVIGGKPIAFQCDSGASVNLLCRAYQGERAPSNKTLAM